jgi:hypothetical protein
LLGKGADESEHDPGEDGYVTGAKAKGPLKEVSLDPVDLLPERQLRPLEVLFRCSPPLDAGLDEFEERPGFFLSQLGLQFLVQLQERRRGVPLEEACEGILPRAGRTANEKRCWVQALWPSP